MVQGPRLTPELLAYLEVAAIGAGIVLLADLALLWVWVAGRIRGQSLLARRWSAAHVLVAFQAFLLLTLGFGILAVVMLALALPAGASGTRAEQQWTSAGVITALVVQNIAMAAVVLYTVLVLYDQRPAAVGLSLRNWAPKAALGLLAAAVVVPLNLALERLSILALQHAAFPRLVQRAYQEQFAQLLSMFKGPGGLALEILLIGFIAPFGEELFFRGFAYRCFRARWGPVAGMLASAAFFAAIHLHPVGLLPILFVGCVLAYLYERTGTLVAPFALHAANNMVAVLAAYFSHGR